MNDAKPFVIILGIAVGAFILSWFGASPSAGRVSATAACPPVSSTVVVTCRCAPTSDEPDPFPQLPPSAFVDARGDRVRP